MYTPFIEESERFNGKVRKLKQKTTSVQKLKLHQMT